MNRILLAVALFASPLMAQEPSRDAQLLDLYRQRVTILEQQTESLLVALEERNKTIASQEATIKMWEQSAGGKMSRGAKFKLGLSIAGSVAAVVGVAVGR